MTDIATEVSPSLTDFVYRVFAAARAMEFGPIMAEVELYNKDKQVVDATPVVWAPLDGILTRLPTIRCIPVQWPSGPSGALTVPLSKGGLVQLVPQMADITKWHNQGSVSVEPADPRAYQLSDVVAIPGGRSMASPLPADALADDGPVLWGVPFVYLGGSTATDFAALASKIDAHLLALKVYLDALPQGTLAPIPGSPVPPTTVGSLIVKLK